MPDKIYNNNYGPEPYKARLVEGLDGTHAPEVSVGSNINTRFREAFESDPVSSEDWVATVANGDILVADGNAIAASYAVVSKDPWSVNTVTSFETIATFNMPVELAVGLSASQRVLGQEFSTEVVSTETPLPAPDNLVIASISQAAAVLTVNTVLPHNLSIGARIGISGVSDSRLNYPAVVVASVPTDKQFTVTAGPGGNLPSVTAGPFTSGYVYQRSALGLAPNGTSMILENALNTQASFYIRSASGEAQPSGTPAGNHAITIGTTAPVQAINAARTYAFQPTTEFRLYLQADKLQWVDVGVDSAATSNNRYNRTQVVPDPTHAYKIRFRATATPGLSMPIAKIVSATKAGSTTATVVTDRPHGLTTGDYIATYGSRDQTNFANLTAATVVASVVDATTFTVIWGASVTATAFGGVVWRVNGGNLPSACGAIAQVLQSVTRTANVLNLVGNASWSGLSIGDYVNVGGCYDTAGVYVPIDGAYRIQNIATTTLTLEPINDTVSPTGIDIALTNVGGSVIRRVDWRLSFVRLFDYVRERVEMLPRPSGDQSAALPVNVQNTPSVTQSGTWNIGTIVGGNVAEDAAAGTSPLITGGVVRTATTPVTLVAGDAVRDTHAASGAKVVKPYAVPEAGWIASLALTTTTAVAAAAAAGASLKRHITALQAINTGAATVDLIILDGATERWRLPLPINVPVAIEFPTELTTTANTALNFNLSAAGTVRANVQGYTAA